MHGEHHGGKTGSRSGRIRDTVWVLSTSGAATDFSGAFAPEVVAFGAMPADFDALTAALLQLVADERTAARADPTTAAIIRRAAVRHAVACTMLGLELDAATARASTTPGGVRLTIDLVLLPVRRSEEG